MKLYKVSMDGDFGDADGRSYWTQRKSDIPSIRARLWEQCHDGDTREPVVETVEFLPTVQGIVDMLNRHADRG